MTFHLLIKCGRFAIALWPFQSVAVFVWGRFGGGRFECHPREFRTHHRRDSTQMDSYRVALASAVCIGFNK